MTEAMQVRLQHANNGLTSPPIMLLTVSDMLEVFMESHLLTKVNALHSPLHWEVLIIC